jgi:hypothetical protein
MFILGAILITSAGFSYDTFHYASIRFGIVGGLLAAPGTLF